VHPVSRSRRIPEVEKHGVTDSCLLKFDHIREKMSFKIKVFTRKQLFQNNIC